MTNFRRQFLVKTLMLVDLGILALSFVLAAIQVWHLTASSSFASFISMRVKVLNILLVLGLLYSWHLIFSVFGLYGSKRLGDRKQEIVDVLRATSVVFIMLAVAAAVFRVRMITPAFIVVFWAISSVSLILCRLLMREFLASVRTLWPQPAPRAHRRHEPARRGICPHHRQQAGTGLPAFRICRRRVGGKPGFWKERQVNRHWPRSFLRFSA